MADHLSAQERQERYCRAEDELDALQEAQDAAQLAGLMAIT
jgi:hypothetical protein